MLRRVMFDLVNLEHLVFATCPALEVIADGSGKVTW